MTHSDPCCYRRLPSTFIPIQYDVSLTSSLQRPWDVSGVEEIHLQTTPAGRNTRCIVMHAADMDIWAVS